MADRKVLEFIQCAEQDPALHAKVRAVRVDDKKQAFAELATIAQSAGYAVSAEALESGLKECAPRELSDDALDAVAGGGMIPCNAVQGVSFKASGLQTSAFKSFFVSPNAAGNPSF